MTSQQKKNHQKSTNFVYNIKRGEYMSNISWKDNNSLLSLNEDWGRNHELYANMAYGAVEDLIMNSSHMESICDIIGETASFTADMWNLDFIEDEFDDLITEDFKDAIYKALDIMASNVEKRAKELGYENPNMQGPFNS